MIKIILMFVVMASALATSEPTGFTIHRNDDPLRLATAGKSELNIQVTSTSGTIYVYLKSVEAEPRGEALLENQSQLYVVPAQDSLMVTFHSPGGGTENTAKGTWEKK